MSSPLVGLSNVPNVYITKINLYNNNTQTYGVDIFLLVKDKMEAGKFIWSGDQLFFNFMKVCLIQTTNVQLANAIQQGNLDPHPDELSRSTLYDDDTMVTVIPIREFYKRSTGARCDYTKNVETLVEYDTENLTVFALCYLDSTALAQHLQINLGTVLKKYYGSVTSEKIYENGELVDTTNMFLKSGSVIWAGPVHFRNGVYMEGPVHTTKPHGVLKKLIVSNIKLTDARTPLFSSRAEISVKSNPLISNLHYSINKKARLMGIFSVNMEQFALTKTQHGRKMFGTSQRMFMDFINTLKVSSIYIERHQIRTVRMTNAVGTTKIETASIDSYDEIAFSADGEPGRLKETATIQQIYLNDNGLIRSYHFVDDTPSIVSDGQFRYTAKIQILDKSEDFIAAIITNLESNLNSLTDIVTYLNRNANYDHNMKELRQGIEVPTTIQQIIELYYNVLSYSYDITPVQELSLMRKKITLFLTGNYRTIYGERFLRDFKQLMTRFLNKFRVAPKYSTTHKQGVRNSFQPGLIEMSKRFEDIIEFSQYMRSYDYLGVQNNTKVAILSKEEYMARGQQELKRFFDLTKAATPANFKDLDNNISNAITNLGASQNSFFSPLGFVFNDEMIDISSLDKLNANGLSEKFLASTDLMQDKIPKYKASFKKSRSNVQMTPNADGVSRSSALPKSNQFAVSIPAEVTKIFNLENETPQRTEQYLGDNSKFVLAEEETREPAPEADIQEITQAVSVATTYRTQRNKNDFDITARENVLDSFLTSTEFSIETLKMSPLCFKALLCSRAEGVKNNILSAGGDILTDPSMMIASEMLFMTTQKVEMIIGYTKDSNGLDIISQPIWEIYNPEKAAKIPTVVCRMRYTEMPEIGLMPAEQFVIPVQNSTFLVSDKNLFVSNISISAPVSLGDDFNFNTKNQLSKNIKYATNNIVVQPATMNPVSGFKSRNTTTASKITGPTTTSSGPSSMSTVGNTPGGAY